MKDMIYLVLVIVLGAAVIKWYTGRSSAPRIGVVKKLKPEEAKAQLDGDEDIVLLDVRTKEEFAAGHIPGAVCIPVDTIGAGEELPFGVDVKLFVYCHSGSRSARAARKLVELGYTDVTDMGGIINWPYEIVTE